MQLTEKPILEVNSINQELTFAKGIHLDILRLDKVHPYISGNKWYKLKYNLLEAKAQSYSQLLTFGGAFSNHLYATAAAAKEYGFQVIGVVRGEEHLPLNSTLEFATAQGMKLKYVNREAYQNKEAAAFLASLTSEFGPSYIIPEGGSNVLAVKACTEIVEQPEKYDYICCCVGTGGTIAGIIEKTQSQAKVLGFSALKGGSFLYDNINLLTQGYSGKIYKSYQIIEDYHFGGYAKADRKLVNFINTFKKEHHIQLDPIYTGKMVYSLYDMLKNGYFGTGDRILIVHSGGLQGIAGFNQRYQKKNLYISID
ncbi:pyridoxal-phosphate dependent enzyme [Porifericola rhodea]|uniref:1-aminocyclopropane-1-carboxylate deaminase/D-cysteine desulfhydrase n=1 Tax=Porifericola rhodea TaxID=930972 RepID=UPI0026663165|nr:pyridoxal-phosphate dependent enzyme [Porifericola rhodea]WKN33052.1 pyridoxal-phosphate dependent enzyme [Porifericola rhodea]